MYILLDIEWLTNEQRHICPTQIAALRVTNKWVGRDLFYSRIRPRDSSFYDWDSIAYSGGDASDFLNAERLSQVVTDLMEWLKPDDIICVWHVKQKSVLETAVFLSHKQKLAQSIVILQDYLSPYLAKKQISRNEPQTILRACHVEAAEPEHRADKDVLNMRRALETIDFCADDLRVPPVKSTSVTPRNSKSTKKTSGAFFEYYLDELVGVVHMPGCQYIHPEAKRIKSRDKSFFLRNDLYFCGCTTEEQKRVWNEKNKDTVARCKYNFIYAEDSEIFHRSDCDLALNTIGHIRRSVSYTGCESTGRRPCKVCKPVAGNLISYKQKRTINNVQINPLTEAERRGLERFYEARQERINREGEELKTPVQKEDFFTLTNPGFAFFTVPGYSTFHLRPCSKLRGESQFKGFATYKEATRAGYLPCQFCKPSKKHDITCAVSIKSQHRCDESLQDLEALCAQFGYEYVNKEVSFEFKTPAGKWIIETAVKPYRLSHINLVMNPDNETDYHRQPRLFFSLVDAFWYIHQHDSRYFSVSG